MFFSKLSLAALAAAASLVNAAPLAPILSAAGDAIPDDWIVVMKDGMSTPDFLNHLSNREAAIALHTTHTFDLGGFKGYSGTFTSAIVNSLISSLDVAYIEPDVKVTTSALTTQSNAPWGLGRISHRLKGSTDYVYDNSAGAGQYAYVIDTGIFTQHVEFEGRATFGVNLVGDGIDTDANGHGTHCSGTIGSRAYGVAKKINLIGVKVLGADGSGSSSGVIAGIQWAVNDAKSNGRISRSVGSMSLGSTYSSATNQAVAAAVSNGLFMAVAAGNNAAPARLYSPASETTACTVGATDKNDAQASYSNYGSVVDIFAPGTDILSTWIGSPTAMNVISGTSMATPHIAGLAAYLTGLEGARSPAALCQRIRTLATAGVLTGQVLLSGTPNLLAYNGNGA